MTRARPDTWMPWHIGKYLGDTMHLTTEQHGAYLLLLAAGWMRRGQLPDDDEQLASIVRLPLERWRAMRGVVAAFFMVRGGTWRQKRQIEELTKAMAITKARSEAGQKGGRPKATGKQNESQALTNEKQNESPGSDLIKPGLTPLPLPLPNAIPLSESLSESSSAIGGTGSQKKMNGFSGRSGSGKWDDQQQRDQFAVQACVELLPGRDNGERWAIAMAAEDEKDPNHHGAVRAMRRAAKAAGVGWVSPERRCRSG